MILTGYEDEMLLSAAASGPKSVGPQQPTLPGRLSVPLRGYLFIRGCPRMAGADARQYRFTCPPAPHPSAAMASFAAENPTPTLAMQKFFKNLRAKPDFRPADDPY